MLIRIHGLYVRNQSHLFVCVGLFSDVRELGLGLVAQKEAGNQFGVNRITCRVVVLVCAGE